MKDIYQFRDLNYTTVEEAVKIVASGNRVFLHGSAATPVPLIKAMQNRYEELRDVELVTISTLGDVDFNDPKFRESFFVNALFVSANTRAVVNTRHGEYVPVFLSQIPKLFQQKILPLDVAFIQVSPPDQHGFCSIGTSVDIARAAIHTEAHIVAIVNPQMPRTHGDGFIHYSKFDMAVYNDEALPEVDYSSKVNDVVKKIAYNVASLIDDGATLQMGIGSIPDQVLLNLQNHRHLGIHTEMFSDGVVPLINSGVIDNNSKHIYRGQSVTGFVLGTRKVYDFVDDNPSVQVLNIGFVNDMAIIRQNPKATAINSALEIDLTGQVCADSIGTKLYSGIGGQMDFIQGAALSEGGKPIIALPSTASNGASRIVPYLHEGAGVVTTRGHVHWVVTEYGMVNLFGKNLEQRAEALCSIAHPDHREELEKAVWARFRK